MPAMARAAVMVAWSRVRLAQGVLVVLGTRSARAGGNGEAIEDGAGIPGLGVVSPDLEANDIIIDTLVTSGSIRSAASGGRGPWTWRLGAHQQLATALYGSYCPPRWWRGS